MDLQGQKEIAQSYLNQIERSEEVASISERTSSSQEKRERQVMEGFRRILYITGHPVVKIKLAEDESTKSSISAELIGSSEYASDYYGTQQAKIGVNPISRMNVFKITTDLDEVIARIAHRQHRLSEEEYGGMYHFHDLNLAEQTLAMLNGAISNHGLNPRLNEELLISGITLIDPTENEPTSN